MAKQAQGFALDPPGAEPLDLMPLKKRFPKAAGLAFCCRSNIRPVGIIPTHFMIDR